MSATPWEAALTRIEDLTTHALRSAAGDYMSLEDMLIVTATLEQVSKQLAVMPPLPEGNPELRARVQHQVNAINDVRERLARWLSDTRSDIKAANSIAGANVNESIYVNHDA